MPSYPQSQVAKLAIQLLAFLFGLSFLVAFGPMNRISFWLTGFIGALLLIIAWLLNRNARQAQATWAALYSTAYVGFWRGLSISLFTAIWFGIAWQSGYRR